MSLVLSPASSPSQTTLSKTKTINPLATSHVSTFEDAYHRRISYTCGTDGRSAVGLAKGGRLVVLARETGVVVWRLPKRVAGGGVDDAGLGQGQEGGFPLEGEGQGSWEMVLEMDLNVRTNIVSSAISDDGKWLAVADWYETKLFALSEDVSFCFSSLSTHAYLSKTIIDQNGRL